MQTAEQIQKVAVTLPDGSVRDYDAPVTGLQIAESIGKRLAKDALAVKIDGTLRDLTTSITTDAAVEIVTRDHADVLGLIRHDAAHVMAEAVQALYPGTQVTIGPAIANGFYYDFARPRALHARRSGKDRGEDAGDRFPRRPLRARSLGPRRGRSASSRTRARSTRPS